MLNKVILHVYDLSQGMATTFLNNMPGLTGGVDGIDGIWHTGVEVFGEEYFYGGGIQHMSHFAVIGQFGLHPKESIVLGKTKKTKQELEQFLLSINSRFTPETYNLLKNNCNNFSYEVHGFLLPPNSSDSVERIDFPSYIIELPERFARTPIGQMLMPMWERLERDYLMHTLVPFNNASPSPSISTTTTTTSQSVSAPAASISTSSISSSSISNNEDSDTFISVMITSSDSEVKSRNIRVPIKNPDTFTLNDLHQYLAKETGLNPEDQRIIFQGQVLKDPSAKIIGGQISSLKSGQTIHLVPRPGAKVSKYEPKAESKISTALKNMKHKTGSNEAQYSTAVKTLLKVVENIEEHPNEIKYRKINKSNAVFEKRICSVPGAPECMAALGFDEVCELNGKETVCFYVLTPSAEAWEILLSAKKELQAAASSLPQSQQTQQTQQTQAQNQQSSIPAPPTFPSFPGMGGGMPGGMPGGLPFGLNPGSLMSDPRVQQVLQNPSMMQSILNHPMAQSLAANDPMLQSQLRMLQQNPGMLSSIFPNSNSAPQQQQQQQTNQNQGTNNTNTNQNDNQMTEEEMLAEAIARSLREQ